ncbi:unnamed protein product [Lactuca virosa]|uniref:HAT C-terminal dimerisation domain-containing protein n=1 Tax=Lactuca virosa TaxID=75947 RepID=A0AAU9LGH1_9ASTR|nr:unnamed protein product [Lactuca virosa]
MVVADWKPSMGLVYGELKVAKEEIMKALGGNEKAYKPIIDIINHKMKGRLDSKLHLTAYLLNPYYHYKDSQLQHDPDVMDAVLEFFDTLLCGDFEMQRQVMMIDLPKYKEKVDRFGADLAIKGCMVNNADFDPARWWGLFGGSTPHLKRIAMRILSLTSSSSGCERNWSTFEARKDRTLEVLLANDSHASQEWMIDGDDGDGDEVEPESVMEAIDEALGNNNNQVPCKSSTPRELFDEDFESDNEEQMFEEDEYESDGVQIVEELED